MLRAEQEHHLREAAFCSDEAMRYQHVGVVRWLDSVLSGTMMSRYAYQAKERLEPQSVLEEAPEKGTPWMEEDGL